MVPLRKKVSEYGIPNPSVDAVQAIPGLPQPCALAGTDGHIEADRICLRLAQGVLQSQPDQRVHVSK